MKLLDRWERRLRPFAVPNLTVSLIVCQVLVYVVMLADKSERQASVLQHLLLIPERVLAGEVWRLVTFLCVPPFTNVLFAFFFWYLFYLMGTALEQQWGALRYNAYLLIGYVATVALSCLPPGHAADNRYLQASVFLAFAFLYPDFELLLFFLLPVKIKWLALLTWIYYFLAVAGGGWGTRLAVLASICNFLVFFGRDIVERLKTGRRRMATQAARLAVKQRPYIHRCTVCGITDRTHPSMEFRYCSQCAGTHGYCQEHLRNHEHIVAADEVPED